MDRKSLVIVESPAKCKKIESYLGDSYHVIACYGHLRYIPNLDAIDVKNDFQISYALMEDALKKKQIEILRKKIELAKEVILATDDDREGEAIAWHVCDLFKLPLNSTRRIVFHEITESAIHLAMGNPRSILMSLVYSQMARQIIDMLVGYTITPLLWKHITKTHQSSLSAGRCQTPALRLIYDNQKEINKNTNQLAYHINATFTKLNINFQLNQTFDDYKIVNSFFELSLLATYHLELGKVKNSLQKPPEPLITSSLQQSASSCLHMSPKETMGYAQELYENGFITYIRTDSRKYSREFLESVHKYVTATFSEKSFNQNSYEIYNIGKQLKEDKGKTDEGLLEQSAHEAIRPVNFLLLPKQITSSSLSKKAGKLYELIWTRSIQSCMSSAQSSQFVSKITLDSSSYYFTYKAQKYIFKGWKELGSKFILQDNDDNALCLDAGHTLNKEEEIYNYLKLLKTDIPILPKIIKTKLSIHDKKTHYTEAKLIQMLEEMGIGRPSTYASLIEKIKERGYVEKTNIQGIEYKGLEFICDFSNKNKEIETKDVIQIFGNETNKLVITSLGIVVIELLLNHVTKFFEYEYTRFMENELDQIANKNADFKIVLNTCYNELQTVVSTIEDLKIKKFEIKINDYHFLIMGKYGLVVKELNAQGKLVKFHKVKENINLDLLNKDEIKLKDILTDNTTCSNPIFKFQDSDVFLKRSKYGLYVSWGTNKLSLKDLDLNDSQMNLDNLEEPIKASILEYLYKMNKITQTHESVLRVLNDNLSIRKGKYGDYIFYKKKNTKKAVFYKLNGFKNYLSCDIDLILNWILQTHKVS